jgi:cytochrome d ubiquinol oxidase subunit I
VEIPRGLSILAFADSQAEVKGLNDFPREEWPPVAKVHLAFQTMVGTGVWMALLAAALLWRRLRGRAWPTGTGWLRALVWTGPLGVVAMEAGWLVTEWGRQPWVVRGALKTADAVTTVPHLAVPFFTFTLVYLFLGAVVLFVLARQVRGTLEEAGAHA